MSDDPKSIVTPYAFEVAPDLLGRPLAGPFRRGAAVLVDLIVVGGVVLFKEVGGPLFAVACGWIAWRIADPEVDLYLRRRWVRTSLRVVGGATVCLGLLTFLAGLLPDSDPDREEIRGERARGSATASATARAASPQARWAAADSLLDVLAAAAAAGDTVRVAELREEVRETFMDDRTALHLGEAERLRETVREARATPSLLGLLRRLADELGLGVGWLGLYFTAFLRVWQGRTPGKRLLGIRVVKVNGEEMGWWDAFGRFGGYAASMATGLVGFFQILWDRNRQGLHDRIAGTVVIRE